jgi:hypothetical protein
MSGQHLSQIEDVDGIRGVTRLVALECAYHADRKGIVRMSQSEMAVHCGISRRAVAKAFNWLQDCSALQREGHGRYRLTLEEYSEVVALPRVAGAMEELDRLQALRQPDQGIAYRSDGWPVLQQRGYGMGDGGVVASAATEDAVTLGVRND